MLRFSFVHFFNPPSSLSQLLPLQHPLRYCLILPLLLFLDSTIFLLLFFLLFFLPISKIFFSKSMVLLKIHQQQASCYFFSIQQGILEVILLLIVVIDDFSPAFGTIHNRRNSICSLISSSSFFCASSWPIHDEGVSSSLLSRSTGVSIPRNFLDNPRQQTYHREDSRIC